MDAPDGTNHEPPGPPRRSRRRPKGARLRESERLIRRFALNQPNGRQGMNPGWFRNTFSGQEYERLRANILLWRRARVYFEDTEDALPVCKSLDGLVPAPVIQAPKHDRCGHWNAEGEFIPECRLAAWRFLDGRRCPPPCQEAWSFLGVLEDDGLPFWISLKGGSLRPARQFLSMCYEVTHGGKYDLLDCTITLTSRLVHGRGFDYYIVCFSDPHWFARADARHRRLTRLLGHVGHADIQRTFDAEQATEEVPVMAG